MKPQCKRKPKKLFLTKEAEVKDALWCFSHYIMINNGTYTKAEVISLLWKYMPIGVTKVKLHDNVAYNMLEIAAGWLEDGDMKNLIVSLSKEHIGIKYDALH